MTSYQGTALQVRARHPAGARPGRRVLVALGLVAIVGALGAPPDAAAQSPSFALDVRAGGLHSTPLADVEIVVPRDEPSEIETMELTTGFTPFVEVGALARLSPFWTAEVRVGVTSGEVRGTGPGGNWDAGSVTTVHVLAGLGVEAFPGVVLRAGVGKALLGSSDVRFLEEGEQTGLLVSGGIAYEPPVALPVAVEADVQRHGFGAPVLRRAGGVDGAVRRLALSVRYRFGAGP